MNRAAHGIARQVGVIQGLGHHALSGESGITVNENGKIFFPAAFSGAILLGARPADRDRIHCFQVAGIRHQVDMNLALPAVTYSPVAPM